MSTRSTTHFVYEGEEKPTAIIYRHSDGYPEGAGRDILKFLDECEKFEDSRFGDPSYLAARYVVFLASKFANKGYDADFNPIPADPWSLEFTGVGVCGADPCDIEFRYVVICGRGRPVVQCFSVRGGAHGELVEGWQKGTEEKCLTDADKG